jgi:hypothetical protein
MNEITMEQLIAEWFEMHRGCISPQNLKEVTEFLEFIKNKSPKEFTFNNENIEENAIEAKSEVEEQTKRDQQRIIDAGFGEMIGIYIKKEICDYCHKPLNEEWHPVRVENEILQCHHQCSEAVIEDAKADGMSWEDHVEYEFEEKISII